MNEKYRRTTIFQWNANSLRTKMADFRKLVAEFKFPVIAISEAHTDDQFRLAGYASYSSKRSRGPSRALICVNQQYDSTFLCASSSDGPEFVACKVRFGEKTLSVISIYIEAVIAVTCRY